LVKFKENYVITKLKLEARIGCVTGIVVMVAYKIL